MPIIVRIIGPDKFGALNFSASLITYFSLLINYGFDLTATRAIAKNKDNKEERNRIFSEVLCKDASTKHMYCSICVYGDFCTPNIRGKRALYFYFHIMPCPGYYT